LKTLDKISFADRLGLLTAQLELVVKSAGSHRLGRITCGNCSNPPEAGWQVRADFIDRPLTAAHSGIHQPDKT
jgi:acetone carboxylase gamma subunit